jgi:hypothetical protein
MAHVNTTEKLQCWMIARHFMRNAFCVNKRAFRTLSPPIEHAVSVALIRGSGVHRLPLLDESAFVISSGGVDGRLGNICKCARYTVRGHEQVDACMQLSYQFILKECGPECICTSSPKGCFCSPCSKGIHRHVKVCKGVKVL